MGAPNGQLAGGTTHRLHGAGWAAQRRAANRRRHVLEANAARGRGGGRLLGRGLPPTPKEAALCLIRRRGLGRRWLREEVARQVWHLIAADGAWRGQRARRRPKLGALLGAGKHPHLWRTGQAAAEAEPRPRAADDSVRGGDDLAGCKGRLRRCQQPERTSHRRRRDFGRSRQERVEPMLRWRPRRHQTVHRLSSIGFWQKSAIGFSNCGSSRRATWRRRSTPP